MKAKEYFDKYFENVDAHNMKSNMYAFFEDLRQECLALCKTRRSSSNATVDGAIREINQKYNAVATLCEKKFGRSLLARNGFKNYWDRAFREAGIA